MASGKITIWDTDWNLMVTENFIDIAASDALKDIASRYFTGVGTVNLCIDVINDDGDPIRWSGTMTQHPQSISMGSVVR